MSTARLAFGLPAAKASSSPDADRRSALVGPSLSSSAATSSALSVRRPFVSLPRPAAASPSVSVTARVAASSVAAGAASGSAATFVGASSSLSSSARLVAAALRQDPNIFDYDAAVQAGSRRGGSDSGVAATTLACAANGAYTATVRPASRYIGSLVRAASDREARRAAVQQRSRQLEIEQEETMDEYRGKERFLTAAYKQQVQAQQATERADSGQGNAASAGEVRSDHTAATAAQAALTPDVASAASSQPATASAAVSTAATAAAEHTATPVATLTRRQSAELEQDAAGGEEKRQQQQQQPAVDDGSADRPATAAAAAAALPLAPSVSGRSADAGLEQRLKRAAARERFLARKRAATSAHGDG